MSKTFRIGTRDSQLAIWQATRVQHLLKSHGISAELVPVKSEGDLDLETPLYAMGVQGIFTRSLDQALLNQRIDLAVHSMKDVPVQLPKGIVEAAVLKRDSPFDILVLREETADSFSDRHSPVRIASSSLRRRSQWLHRFPQDGVEPIRGNVNTRLKKLAESDWKGAIFAAAGLERIGLRPSNAIELDWMLPAPAQGALLVVCRGNDDELLRACTKLNDDHTAFSAKIERDFLSALMGGCSTPVGALAEIENEEVYFRGNLTSIDGKKQVSIEKYISVELAASLGTSAAQELLEDGASEILQEIKHA
ncbi:MAG TPA: hydroxymethylbilane synthase [Puia sp.]|jgi:hydroxymethylbilane synthase